jgi:hypothetical protein
MHTAITLPLSVRPLHRYTNTHTHTHTLACSRREKSLCGGSGADDVVVQTQKGKSKDGVQRESSGFMSLFRRSSESKDKEKEKEKERKEKDRRGSSAVFEKKVLDLSRRDLLELSPEIWKLQKLETLNLYLNKLTSLPAEIGSLALPCAAPSSSPLRSVRLNKQPNCACAGKLTCLTALGLNENSLTELPKEIGQLRSLKILDLRHNKLTSLPIGTTFCFSSVDGCSED